MLLRRPRPTSPARHRALPLPAGRTPRRGRRPLASLAALALVGMGVVSGYAPGASAAGTGTLLLEDNFMGATTVGQSYVAGGRNFTACLTAGASTATTPIPGCGLAAGVRDADGSGALRLTAATNNQAGFLVYDKALPTKAGLDITFNQYQWGGTKADGISFFLADGAYTLDAAGAFGGSLGYHHQAGATAPSGVDHALLGVGFDVWGNYTVETNDTASCGTTYTNATLQKNTVAVRGPGHGKSRYCLLGPVAAAPELNVTSATRPAPVVTRIVVDPPSQPSPQVSVYLDGRLVTQVAQPAEIAATPTFKFGWGASTGGSNDNHEINFLSVESVVQILPDLGLTAAASAVPAEQAAGVTLTARTSAAAGPVPAGEAITLSAAAPAGATFGTVSGTGWDCSGTTPSALSCVRTSGTAVDPGSTLPAVTANLERTPSAPSGSSTLVATVTSASDDQEAALLADNTASALVRWNPVASAVDAGVIDASATPSTVTRPASVVGTAPYTWAVSPVTDPAVGTVTVAADGTLSLTPTAGASGRLQATYTATDPSGGQSNAATVAMTVRPVGTGGSVDVHGTTSAVTTLAPLVGTGPFTVGTVTPAAGLTTGTVTIDGDGRPVVTVRAAEGFSGPTAVTFTVADASGVVSAPVTLAVTVHPVAQDDVAEGTLDADGLATVTTQLPAPAGTGPFTYALVGDGDLGGAQASVTASGELTVVASPGVSGVRTVTYTTADGTSTSEPATVTVTVRPYLGAVATTPGVATSATTSPAPVAHGSAVTFEHTTPPGTTVSVAADGAVTLDTAGASGTFVVQLTARDEDGVASAPVPVTFEVAPAVAAVGASTTASATPATVVLTPAPVGTGPFTTVVTEGLVAAEGTVTVVDGALHVVPAAGVSGRLEATFTVTDGSGLVSAPATATVDVRPVAAGTTAEARSGTRTVVTLPAPTGTGPFTWALASATPAAAGTVTVADGELVLDAAATWSGDLTVTYTVTDVDGLVSDAATVTVTVVPTAPGGGTTTPAVQPGTTGSPVVGPTPAPAGTGPFTFVITSAPDPAEGTATIDPTTGVITFTPAPGFSGTVDVGYRATDPHGNQSDEATVSFQVAPVAVPPHGGTTVPGTTPEQPVTTPAGRPVTVRLPEPVGTGPFTWEVVDGGDPADATVTLDPVTGELHVVPAPGRSGRIAVVYRVVDGSGLASAPSTAYVTVQPLTADDAVRYTPGAQIGVDLPAPVGTGPFTWSLLDAPTAAQGTVELDAATGRLTFRPAAGFSGSLALRYVVTDANGVTSEAATVTFSPVPASPAPAVAGAATGVLARTGADVGVVLATALGLLSVGAALVAVRRRQA